MNQADQDAPVLAVLRGLSGVVRAAVWGEAEGAPSELAGAGETLRVRALPDGRRRLGVVFEAPPPPEVERALDAAARLGPLGERPARPHLASGLPDASLVACLESAVARYPFGAVLVFDRELRYVIAGGTGLEDAGLDPRAMVGRTVHEVLPAATAAVIVDDYRAALAGATRSAVVPFADRVYEVDYGPVRDAAGRVTWGMAITHEVTTRETMRRELERRELMLAEAQRIARLGSWALDLGSGALEWSEESSRLAGWTRSPSSAEAYVEGTHPLDRGRVREALQTRAGFRLEHRLSGARERWVRLEAKLVYDEELRPVRLAGTIQDVTEARALEAERRAHARELEAARSRAEAGERTKTEFLATMSHEMRTPLNGIIASASLLAGQLEDELQSDLLATIQSSGESLLRVIDDVLELSSILRGEVALEAGPFLLHEQIEHALAAAAPAARSKGLLLGYTSRLDGAGLVHGDASRVRQILDHLVGNAVKFTCEGSVEVEARFAEAGLELSVRDTGPGVERQLSSRIFEPFRQGDGGFDREHGGLGIGLVMVRRLAEAMGGSVAVENPEGGGALFRVRLALTASASASPLRPLSGRAVAVRVEDPRVGDLLTHHLDALGARVDPAAPIAIVDAGRPDGPSQRRIGLAAPGAAQTDAGLAHPLRRAALARAVLRAADAVAERAESAEPGRLPPARALRVLVAEDNPVNQRVLRRMLERLGHRVEVAEDGQAALERHREARFDLILMDLQMPRLDGLAATRAIRAREAEGAPPTPIWAVTANALPSDRSACAEAGMDAFLAKPVRLPELTARLEAMQG